MDFLKTFLSMLFGGGIIGLIEFLIRRKDEKEDKNSEIVASIKALDMKIDTNFNEVNKKIDVVEAKSDERNAVLCRVRILRFNDELQRSIMHTKESWDQVMADINDYEIYCHDHPKFKNGRTVATIEYITSEYKERLEKHDFL